MAGRLERSAEEGANGKRPGRQSRRSRPRGAGCWEAEQLEKDEEEAGVDFLSGAAWGGGAVCRAGPRWDPRVPFKQNKQ